MRTIAILLGLIGLSLMTSAQVVTLKFSAFLNSHSFNSDSILITNLTHPGDTTLVWPDTTLVLGTTGIAGLAGENTAFDFFLCSENPFNEKTYLQLNLPSGGEVVIRVTDVSGKKLTELRRKMQEGTHRISYNSSKQGLHLVTAYFNSESRLVKVISTTKGKGPEQLTYDGISDLNLPAKTTNTTQTFTYAVGDNLRLTCYYADTTKIILAAPVISTNYQFYFVIVSCPGIPSFTYGGQVYNTVYIAGQCWMKENLNIGIMVPSNNLGFSHSECSNNFVIEKYCYNNDSANCAIYGGLYDWDEMMQYSHNEGVQGICPTGWHIPTNDEWCQMTTFLDTAINCMALGYTGEVAGGMLKETGTAHWQTPNFGATNSTSFTALGSGMRQQTGSFFGLGLTGSFWTSTEADSTQAANWATSFHNAKMDHFGAVRKTIGASLRCIKD